MVVVPKAGTTRIEGLVGTGHQAFGSVVLPHLSQADGEGAVGTALAEGLGDRFEDGLSVRQVGARRGQGLDREVADGARVDTQLLGERVTKAPGGDIPALVSIGCQAIHGASQLSPHFIAPHYSPRRLPVRSQRHDSPYGAG